jgi:tetratricopeptide (TPR) repeat protein
VEWTDIVVHHVGYQDPGVRARKFERNLRLLQMDYADNPDNPATLLFIGRTYVVLGRPAEALPILHRAAKRLAAGDPHGRALYRLVVECHRLLGQTQTALDVCIASRANYPLDAGLRAQEAQLRNELDDLAGAESCYLHLLRVQEPNSEPGVLPAGLLDFWVRHQLAALHAKQGRTAEAKARGTGVKS